MATSHNPKCEKHVLTIDKICKDCEMFICSVCANMDHLDHNCDTITTAANIRRRGLKKYLLKIKKEELQQINMKMEAAAKQMEDNKAFYDNEVLKLKNHYDAIVIKVNDIKENNESLLRDCLDEKKSELCKKKSDLENKKVEVMDLVKILEEKHRNMSDYSFIHNLRCLENLISNVDDEIQMGEFPLRYIKGDFNKKILEFVMGKTCADVAELEHGFSTTDPLQNFYGMSIGMECLFKACTIL